MQLYHVDLEKRMRMLVEDRDLGARSGLSVNTITYLFARVDIATARENHLKLAGAGRT